MICDSPDFWLLFKDQDCQLSGRLGRIWTYFVEMFVFISLTMSMFKPSPSFSGVWNSSALISGSIATLPSGVCDGLAAWGSWQSVTLFFVTYLLLLLHLPLLIISMRSFGVVFSWLLFSVIVIVLSSYSSFDFMSEIGSCLTLSF